MAGDWLQADASVFHQNFVVDLSRTIVRSVTKGVVDGTLRRDKP